MIATDVPAAAIRFGTPEQQWLGRVTPGRLRELAADGEFDAGSMGPKAAACAEFVDGGGERAVITSLESVGAGAAGRAGTVVEPVAP